MIVHHNHTFLGVAISALEPLIITLTALTLTDINTMLGTVSVSASLIFTFYKFITEYKKNKQNGISKR